MISILILAIAFLSGLTICYCFLTWILFANLEIKNPRWLALFSVTFAVSVTLFAFYSIDLLQLDSAQIRTYESYFLLALHQIVFMVVLPLLFFSKFCIFYKKILVPSLYVMYLFALYLASQQSQGMYAFIDMFYFMSSQERQIPCFALVGAVCSGLLAGFAAVNTLATYYFKHLHGSVENSEYVEGLESRWIRILQDIANNKRKLAQIKAKDKGGNGAEYGGGGLFKRILEIVTVDKDTSQGELERNIKGSKLMQDETYMNLLEYNVRRAECDYRKTWRGKLETLFGKIAGGVCIYKMFLSAKALMIGQAEYNGGVVKSINSVLIKFFPGWIDAEFLPAWEQHICFFLFAVFLITNVNSILRNLQAIFKRVLKNYAYTFGVSTLMIIASYLTASYFLTSVLMMAASLPPKDETTLHALYKGNKEGLTNTWNATYLLACGLATAIQFLSCLINSF